MSKPDPKTSNKAPAPAGTIFALSSGRGRAGVAVVRVSGPRAEAALKALSGRAAAAVEPRKAVLSDLRDPESGETIDRGLLLRFPGPASVTGEDVVEFHSHGGPAVIGALLAALGKLSGLRPAEPGEFTRRAFRHEKLDLLEVEGLNDLIAAETEIQRRAALRQMGGGLSELYEGWRERLVHLMAWAEAELDFSDEDLPESVMDRVEAGVRALRDEIDAALMRAERGERLREGLSVVILGAPNAGKSTLLNAIAARDVAIVHESAGTTRDILEVDLDLGGWPVTLADTAGLRDQAGAVENEGIRRALKRANDSDVKLCLGDLTASPVIPEAVAAAAGDEAVILLNKVDKAREGIESALEQWRGGHDVLAISAKTGEGVEALLSLLQDYAERMMEAGEAPVATRARHRHGLAETAEFLGQFLADKEKPLELRAEDLRLAARALGRLTGRVDVEELLDVIFADFCIGK